MSSAQNARLTQLIKKLVMLPRETEWVEFKVNDDEPKKIGEYISALANSAVLAGKAHGYVVWGIEDKSRNIVGTTFNPDTSKRGNEDLAPWLLRSLSPQIPFQFLTTEIEGKPVVALKINRATNRPVSFFGHEYIRVGSYNKQLKDAYELERRLWQAFERTPFEKRLAMDDLATKDVLELLDHGSYFSLCGIAEPFGQDQIIERLEADGLTFRGDDGRWAVTNVGAILFARQLNDFEELKRKAIRVIAYADNSRFSTLREQIGTKGYAAGFEGLIGFINNMVPTNEVIGKALRRQVPMYPTLSIREIVANALIHQDFEISGAGPAVEIFADRLEVTNPGEPIIAVDRLLDLPPRSRNEILASLMRRFGICEERGSGIDKVVHETEVYQLPAPEFAASEDSMRSTLFAHRQLNEMDKRDRVRACYMHASLRYVMRDYMTNSSLRERFGIEPKNSATASRLIKEAVEAEAIRAYDSDAGRKYMKYVPWWA